jgi:excisionase family DNA binding protein
VPKQLTSPPGPATQILLATEVADWLRVGLSTVYQWAAAEKIPSLKLNGSVRFLRSDIERWMRDPTCTMNQATSSRRVFAIPRSPSASVLKETGRRVVQRFLRRDPLRPFPRNLPTHMS